LGLKKCTAATLPVFDRPILEACVKAKANYLDIASNEMLQSSTAETVQEEFLVEQFEFAEDFEKAGLKALILAGGDSGLVNIMAREAVDELDEIDYVGIKDYGIVDCDEYRHYKMWTESPNIVQACEKIPGTNDVSWITSVPASILSLMLLRDQIKHVGVFPCEVLETLEKKLGIEKVKQLFRESIESVNTVERLVAEGEIDCDFHRYGSLMAAFKASHFENMKRNQERLSSSFNHETHLIPANELKAEISNEFAMSNFN
jgi:saccharopine dehydrogenase-like NADP-dependent oxidoreductase